MLTRKAITILLLSLIVHLSARAEKLHYPALVEQFYRMAAVKQFWFTSPADYMVASYRFKHLLDSVQYTGLDKNRYHYAEITREAIVIDSDELARLDRIFTDAAISLCKDLYQGADIDDRIRNDEISAKYASADNDFILNKLLTARLPTDVSTFAASFEPTTAAYRALKDELAHHINTNNKDTIEILNVSLNFYRWIHHFHFDRFIVVNIPSLTLRCYAGDEVILSMKVVTGKPSTKTPRFSSYCNEVILYPYWNVPPSIARKELFPKFHRSPAAMDAMNMQLIDGRGRVVDHTAVNWSQYSRSNFPYRFRQTTGCENSLGVIKFNLTDPFDVYMHDTNFKKAFKSDKRFLSHGCIRVEKPLDLGNLLLDNKLDSNFIKACLQGQDPISNRLAKPVPVFVVYLTAEPNDSGTVSYFKDIYRLF